MASPLEDELGDILQKARDGRNWSQKDLAQAVGISVSDIARAERYEWIPAEDQVAAMAAALNLDAATLWAIAQDRYVPGPVEADPGFDMTCLEVFMGAYPVKCYLATCPETGESAVVDTGANPEALIKTVREKNVRVTHILLTHNHPDHAWGLGKLDAEFQCPAWVGANEPKPGGSHDLRRAQEGDTLTVGRMTVDVLSTPGHTAGGVSYKINRTVFSGDCIFAGSMGRANSSWQDLFESITTRLLSFPEDTRLLPGHGPATTVGGEKTHNPFFRGRC